ncbi:unnamed protein product [Ranitomeya imitator]|uniref:Neuroblastoma-amplified sequence n=1 Tax=Ranitomeya imitator TaxID=111125 RepID=A0ABN9KXG3_9NEOB|nr:unnamed protein product [Ranitomeya imitator]
MSAGPVMMSWYNDRDVMAGPSRIASLEPKPAACTADDRTHVGGFEAGELKIVAWNEQEHREKDWCEEPRCKVQVEPSSPDLAEFLYEEQPELLPYRTDSLSIDIVKNWYWHRAEEMEDYARQVDGALSLVRLGKEKNVPGLELLCEDLVTLETLVYEANCDVSLTLKDLHQITDIEKLRLLMENSSEDHYVKNAYQWMVPFLHRCEAQTPGAASALLRGYIVTLAKDDLKFPLKIFQHSKPDCLKKLIPDQDQLMLIALESIYTCERDDQLSLCYDILECLPQRGYGVETDVTKSLHDKVDQLEQILRVPHKYRTQERSADGSYETLSPGKQKDQLSEIKHAKGYDSLKYRGMSNWIFELNMKRKSETSCSPDHYFMFNPYEGGDNDISIDWALDSRVTTTALEPREDEC